MRFSRVDRGFVSSKFVVGSPEVFVASRIESGNGSAGGTAVWQDNISRLQGEEIPALFAGLTKKKMNQLFVAING